MSVDCTDCPFKGRRLHNGRQDPRFYSYKFKASGLRYEVGLAIRAPDIVWIAGPYLPGVLNDLSIFRRGLRSMLSPGERVEGDDGYMGDCPQYCKCPGAYGAARSQEKMRGRLRMRHETVNERLKHFTCLTERFRHDAEKHAAAFRAVAVLTQLAIEGGEELMDMREYDDNLTDAQVEQLYGL